MTEKIVSMTAPPTQAEIEALSRELREINFIGSLEQRMKYDRDLCRRAALMIARLQEAWQFERDSRK